MNLGVSLLRVYNRAFDGALGCVFEGLLTVVQATLLMASCLQNRFPPVWQQQLLCSPFFDPVVFFKGASLVKLFF